MKWEGIDKLGLIAILLLNLYALFVIVMTFLSPVDNYFAILPILVIIILDYIILKEVRKPESKESEEG